MPLWKAILSYDGTHYNGWQVQPGLPTVQGRLSDAIDHVTGERVLPQGSGRTDAGVHALGQVASFALAAPIPAVNLQRALNRALPPSIRVLSITAAEDGFHARHSAVRKTYEYRIFPRLRGATSPGKANEIICPPMLAPYVWDCPWQIDLSVMRCAAMDVLGEHDFTSFAASDPDLATRVQTRQGQADAADQLVNVRRIHASAWTERDGLYVYTVTGSGFLHHMVRNLVGTFVDIGAGRLPAYCIPTLIRDRDRSKAGPTAPARGLFLIDVEY
jgi:tRNA pseudouridine38-40 synthase